MKSFFAFTLVVFALPAWSHDSDCDCECSDHAQVSTFFGEHFPAVTKDTVQKTSAETNTVPAPREQLSVFFSESFPNYSGASRPVKTPAKQTSAGEKDPAQISKNEPKVLFDFNSANLTTNARQSLSEIAARLPRGENIKIHVAGYTDEVGSRSFNIVLGQKRAEAVKSFLVSKGLTASQIHVESKGKEDPISETDSAQNRRVELSVIK